MQPHEQDSCTMLPEVTEANAVTYLGVGDGLSCI